MIEHDGFTLICDNRAREHKHGERDLGRFHAKTKTERTAITKARAEGWFVGAVRPTSGVIKRKIRTKKLVLCHMCKWLVLS